MKKCMRIVLALMVVLIVNTLPAHAERGGHEGYGGGHEGYGGGHEGYGGGREGYGEFDGPGWWWPGEWATDPYYPYYQAPPVTVEQPAELYVQPTPQEEAPSYWYYCQAPQGYYPYVNKCPNGWMRVVPPANPPK
jgi:hypothetical protein